MAGNASSEIIDGMSPLPRQGGAAGGWGAVLALTLCVSTLIASEFMPVSILTPIASDLHLTEGTAGQAISVSGLFAVLTSLTISSLTAGVHSPPHVFPRPVGNFSRPVHRRARRLLRGGPPRRVYMRVAMAPPPRHAVRT